MSTDIEIRKQYDLGEVASFAANAREELGDLFVPQFPRVKIPAGGSLSWEVPGADQDNPDTVKEITGVIVAIKPNSQTYLTPFDERDADDSLAPDFYSLDGKVQVITDEGLARITAINEAGGRDGKPLPPPHTTLATCPYNQWDSGWMAKKKFGKATGNYLSIYLHTGGGAVFPLEIGLSSTNIEDFKRWVSAAVIGQSLKLTDTLVSFGLKKEKSKANIEYSKVTYRVGERLDHDLAAQYAEYAKGIKAVINDDPFAQETHPSAGTGQFGQEHGYHGATATTSNNYTVAYVDSTQDDVIPDVAPQAGKVPAGIAPDGAADLDL